MLYDQWLASQEGQQYLQQRASDPSQFGYQQFTASDDSGGYNYWGRQGLEGYANDRFDPNSLTLAERRQLGLSNALPAGATSLTPEQIQRYLSGDKSLAIEAPYFKENYDYWSKPVEQRGNYYDYDSELDASGMPRYVGAINAPSNQAQTAVYGDGGGGYYWGTPNSVTGGGSLDDFLQSGTIAAMYMMTAAGAGAAGGGAASGEGAAAGGSADASTIAAQEGGGSAFSTSANTPAAGTAGGGSAGTQYASNSTGSTMSDVGPNGTTAGNGQPMAEDYGYDPGANGTYNQPTNDPYGTGVDQYGNDTGQYANSTFQGGNTMEGYNGYQPSLLDQFKNYYKQYQQGKGTYGELMGLYNKLRGGSGGGGGGGGNGQNQTQPNGNYQTPWGDLLGGLVGAYGANKNMNLQKDLMQQVINSDLWRGQQGRYNEPLYNAATQGIGNTAYGKSITDQTGRALSARGYNMSGNEMTDTAQALNKGTLDYVNAIGPLATGRAPNQGALAGMSQGISGAQNQLYGNLGYGIQSGINGQQPSAVDQVFGGQPKNNGLFQQFLA